MKCPSCRAKIKGDENYCNKCRFMVPGAKYFANGGSFSEWKNQINQKGSQQDEPIPVVSAAPESLPEIIPENIPDSAPAARIEPIPAELSPHVPQKAKKEAKGRKTDPAANPDTYSKPESSVYKGPILTASAFVILCSLLSAATWMADYYVKYYQFSGFNLKCFLTCFSSALVWLFVWVAFLAKKRRLLTTAGLILLAVSGLLQSLIWCFVYCRFGFGDTIAYFSDPLVINNIMGMFIPSLFLFFVYRIKKSPWILPAACSFICSVIGIYLSINSTENTTLNILYFLHVSFFFAAGRYFHLRNKQSQVAPSASKPALSASRNRVVATFILSIISAILVPTSLIFEYLDSITYVDYINFNNIAPLLFELAFWILILIALLAKKFKLLLIPGLLLLSVSALIKRLITCALWEHITIENYVLKPSVLPYILELFIPAVLLLFVSFKKSKLLWFLPGWSFAFFVAVHCYIAQYPPGSLYFYISYAPLAFFFIITGRFFYLLKRSMTAPAAEKTK